MVLPTLPVPPRLTPAEKQRRYRLREAERRAKRPPKVYHLSQTVEWATPQALFDTYNAEFGFTLDVCATLANAKCSRYFTAQDDGLAQSWTGEVCWMNPPYGTTIGRWIRKAYESAQAGATVVCLIPARTDTRWWHQYVAHGEIRFHPGRITFVGARNPAPFPNAVVIFRPPGIQAEVAD